MRRRWLDRLAGLVLVSVPALAQAAPAGDSAGAIIHPVFAQHGMVASQDAIATRIGVEVLERGGNAIDAAVAVGFALAVALPSAGNLGGGGFMLVHDAAHDETVAIDYREKAGANAFRDMFLDEHGEADPEKSRESGLAVGVPGTVAGMVLALQRYGTITLKDALAPAIRLAEQGIRVSPELAASLQDASPRLRRWPAAAAIFYHPDGTPYAPGEMLVQQDLARSLQRIAAQGQSGFYDRPVAQAIVAAVGRAGGHLTLDDLEAYQAIVRPPVAGSYRGYDIFSMPPPSSGGVHIVQILNTLEDVPIGTLDKNSAETIHMMAEAMKSAYADRSAYLGDPDFVDVPVKALTSKAYARAILTRIDRERATPATAIKPGDLAAYESPDTTHFSVVDEAGNAVANTYTLNFGYGLGLVADPTGILLNNELDDFSAKPGVANAYGLIGGAANAVEPSKRPLSSMSPTIVLKDGKPFLVTGSPGGSRIITTTLQVIMNVIDHGMNIAEATFAAHPPSMAAGRAARRAGPVADTIRLLGEMGHHVVVKNPMGSTQSIMVTDQGLYGSSDPRTPGDLTLGY